MTSVKMGDLPAATAPAGYVQDLNHPPETKHINAGMTISIVGMVVSTLFILLRIYTKAVLAHIFGIDDIALLLAWLISIALQIMVIWLWAVEHIGVHIWNLTISETNLAVLLVSVCSILYIPLMALAKFSLLLFYRKLSLERWFAYAVYGIMAFIISYSVALGFALIFACTPLERNWDIAITTGHCVNKGALYLATAALNAATDVTLLILPIPMIANLHVPLVQKLGLVAMFSIGSLTLITSLVRLSLLPPMVSDLDTTWAISTPAIWICIEANLVIICGCLPILRLFFRHVAPRLIGEHTETAASGPAGSFGKKPIQSVAELSNLDGRERRQDTEHPYGRMAEWDEWEKDLCNDEGSEEYIMDGNGRIVATKLPKVKEEDEEPPVILRSQSQRSRVLPQRTDSQKSKMLHRNDSQRSKVLPRTRSQRSTATAKSRLSYPTWFSAESAEPDLAVPPPTYVIGRDEDGRYSLRPNPS